MMNARGWFWAAGCVFAIFAADILVAKAQVMAGVTIPIHIGDTPQFLLLLLATTFFVAAALIREREEGQAQTDQADVRDLPS